MTTIACETILTSEIMHGTDTVARLSTFLWTYPRWIHAEGRTHRMLSISEDFEILPPTPSPMEDLNLSRNAASSRAIPVQKMIDAILADPAVPLFWGKNVAGMQHKEELPQAERIKAYEIWMRSMESAIAYAREMCSLGVDDEGSPISAHKQVVNRLLEPYMHIKVLVSATQWDNFLHLRDHRDAEPHIRILAQATRNELNKPAMQVLRPGEWHTPFASQDEVRQEFERLSVDGSVDPASVVEHTLKLSVARCASTSYKTVDGFDMTIARATQLHDKLVGAVPMHASPCEHVAQADQFTSAHEQGNCWFRESWANPELHGNFVGFKQYRRMLPGGCVE